MARKRHRKESDDTGRPRTRRRAARRDRVAARRARAAAPKARRRRRIGLRPSGGYLLAFSASVVTAVLALPPLGVSMAAAGAVGLLIGLVALLTVEQATIPEWIRRRRRMSTALSPSVTASSDGAAVALSVASGGGDPTAPTGVHGTGSDEASVWMEVTAADPFHLSTVSTSGSNIASTEAPETDHPVITMERLAPLMTHGDLVLQRLEAVTYGMRTVLPTPAGRIAASLAGTVPTHQAGRTFLKATLRLDDAHPAILARATDGDFAVGTHRAVLSSVARIRVHAEGMGLSVSVMSPSQCHALSLDSLNWLGEPAEEQRWRWLGGNKAGGVVSVVPTDNPEHQASWTAVEVDRIFEDVRLERNRHTGEIEQSYFLTYATHHDAAPRLPKALGLSVLKGQQVQAASHLIPAAACEELTITRDPLGAPAPQAYAGGLGVYIGTGSVGKVFMQVTRGTGSVLHIAGPDELAQQFLLRMSGQALTVDVRVTPSAVDVDDRWQRFVDGLATPLVTYNGNENADVVVVSPGGEHAVPDDQTVIIVSAAAPRFDPAASLIRSGDDLVVTSGRTQLRVPWVVTQSEQGYLVRQPARAR
ncbi:hypothetical protein [Corynebacterium sp. AOP12-C2-36]|uniref:hypothetical protein n=1 Tax=Corynebacterium sp. AOP12-C2-36 TaxID=3457723 RepID=UPI0040334D6B